MKTLLSALVIVGLTVCVGCGSDATPQKAPNTTNNPGTPGGPTTPPPGGK